MFAKVRHFILKHSKVLNPSKDSSRIRIEDMFWSHLYTLNIQEAWPKQPSKYLGYLFTFIIASLNIPAAFLQSKIIYENMNSVYHLTKILTLSSQQIFIALRLLSLQRNGKKFKEMRELMKSELFQPRNKYHYNVLKEALSKMHVLCGCFIGIMIFTIVNIFLTASQSEEEYVLPFIIWIPYNYKTPSVYYFTCAFLSFTIMYTATLVSTLDLIFLDGVIFVGAICDIIRYDLEHLGEGIREIAAKMDKLNDKQFIEKCFNETFKRCILTHQLLVK